MKRTVPLLITALAGFVLILAFFVPACQKWGESAAVWFDILAAIAFILGGGNLLKVQLKKISDRSPGWGYAAVTLVTFLITLSAGLLKIGVKPTANSEYYGQTFVPVSLGELPEYSVSGTLARRADGLPLPASVRDQLTERDGRLFFRGWMQPDQFADLIDYQDDLKWRASVEELNELAQPPESAGAVSYYRTHDSIAFEGAMTPEQFGSLNAAHDWSPTALLAIESLQRESNRELQLTPIENQYGLPITLTGPLTTGERERIMKEGPGQEACRSMPPNDRLALLQELNSAGPDLSEQQRVIFDRVLSSSWTADPLIDALNQAGAEAPLEKTYRELYAEQQAGLFPLVKTHPAKPATLLNLQQRELIQTFTANPAIKPETLLQQLRTAGPLTDSMAAALEKFLSLQPSIAAKKYELWVELSKTGRLSPEQSDLLLKEYRAQYRREQAVDRVFYASQQMKYPWSGEYTQEGSPFWWIYQYIFEPLLTTTFAMLAFYVASAAFRAFRAKNLEAILLLGTAFIILLGRTFAGYLLTSWIPDQLSALRIDELTVYIMKVVNTGGNRAILIGIALGIASTSLKVLLGIDRSYLGSSDD